ncbi:MAG: AmmeMemoRadiSam system protein A [Sphaerochaetaceae bacterium]
MTEENKKRVLKLCRQAIIAKLTTEPSAMYLQLKQQACAELSTFEGAFVTLKSGKDKNLRGCIGQVISEVPLFHLLYYLAQQSAFADPRFAPVSLAEIKSLSIEVSILTVPKLIDSYKQIRLGIDGIILSCGQKRALFLPQVASQMNWDLKTTLSHLSLKAGLASHGYLNPKCRFETFEAEVFGDAL